MWPASTSQAVWAVVDCLLQCSCLLLLLLLPHLGLSPKIFKTSKWFKMLKLLRRKSFRKSKEFKPSSRSTLNSSSGSVSASPSAAATGGHYYITSRPQRSRSKTINSSADQASQTSIDRKSIGSHRYSSVNLGSPVPAPELIQYTRPPENLTSPVRESLEPPKPTRAAMNVISPHPAGDDTASRLRMGNVMPTPRCLPPTPKRSGHHIRSGMPGGASLPPTAQALPMSSPPDVVIPKPSARMSLRSKASPDSASELTQLKFNFEICQFSGW